VKSFNTNVWTASSRVALALFVLCAFGASAQPADRADLTGTWILQKRASDNPARPRTETATKKGGGVAREVVRGISVFGIPVGSLPLPAKHEPEPLDVDDLAGAEQLLSQVVRIKILLESAAAEFDYGESMSATYVYGARTQNGDRAVHAAWDHDVLEVVHEIEGGARVTETYLLDAAGDLRWTVRFEQKRAETRVVERVFTREL
jgi:hypothetical protein